MKVLIVFCDQNVGGAERQGLLLARYLKEECSDSVAVLSLSVEPGRVATICKKMDVPFHAMDAIWQSRFGKIMFLWRLKKFIDYNQYEILLPYTTFPNIFLGLIWRFTKAKLCVWNQRDEGISINKALMTLFAIRFVPIFISNSKVGAQFLSDNYGVDRNRVHYVKNGMSLAKVDHEEVLGWNARNEYGDQSFLCCMLANITKKKDHETLLRAWSHFVKSGPPSGKYLVLAGYFGDGAEDVRRLIVELKITESVKMYGPVSDVRSFLRSMDLLVHSSVSEGCPNAILEAMREKIPIVASNIPGIRDVVGVRMKDLLFNPGDEFELAEKINLFYQDKNAGGSIASRFVEAGWDRLKKEYDCKVNFREIRQIIAGAVKAGT